MSDTTSILCQVWLVPIELALDHMLFHKSPLQGCCLWFMWAEMARLSCVAVYLDHSARCIISSQGPWPSSWITAPGAASLHTALRTEVSVQWFLPRESGLKGQGCEASAGGDLWASECWLSTKGKKKEREERKRKEGRKKKDFLFYDPDSTFCCLVVQSCPTLLWL